MSGPWEKYAAQDGPWTKYAQTAETPRETTLGEDISQGALNLLTGAVRGAGSIGATILAPVDMARDALAGKGVSLESNRRRRADMDATLRDVGAEQDSWMYQGGKLAGEVAGTAGVGNVLAAPVRALGATRFGSGIEPITEGVARGLQTGGFRVGDLAGTKLGAATRLATGATTGGAAAGLVDPEIAGPGAAIGAALPGAVGLAGRTGGAIRNAIAPSASPEVAALANRAAELGIRIPADRLTNSRPMNAVAASLNYVPLSGRAATEDAMSSQLNRALSRTFGQDSSNVTMALRKADDVLGGKFDATLQGNNVVFGQKPLQDLASVFDTAQKELGVDALKPIVAQVNDLLQKGFGKAYAPKVHGHGGPSPDEVFSQLQNLINTGAQGTVDGQAAYNIKRALDRIGRGNTPTAYHALELKRTLMDALNDSLGADGAKAFAKTRKEYGNMLALEKLAKNGAEGEVSVARLANMRNINNPEMQELADIAAQFVKPREGAHGAAQRVSLGGMTAALGGWAGGPVGAALSAGALMGGGRAANGLLNSQMARNFVLNGGGLLGEPQSLGLLTQGAYRSLPLLPAQ